MQLLWCANLRAALEAGGSGAPPPEAALAACDWVPELDALCLALSSGELLLLDAAQQAARGGAGAGDAAVEEVGAVEGGLAAAAWSPDGELLVLVTGTAQLLLMNKVRGVVLHGAQSSLCLPGSEAVGLHRAVPLVFALQPICSATRNQRPNHPSTPP